MATTEVERSTGVDVEDVPSAEWGWSKMNRAVIQAGGILSAAVDGIKVAEAVARAAVALPAA